MDVELSRRAARALMSPPLADLGPRERQAFAEAIADAPDFEALRKSDRDLIEASEAQALTDSNGGG
jgi:hypothetical protein